MNRHLGGKGESLPWRKELRRNGTLYILIIPVLTYFFIFNYLPMFGIVMAFQDFSFRKGFFGSQFTGFQNFIDLFTGESFGLVMRNTSVMALMNLTIGFATTVILALLLSEVKIKPYKRAVQTVSYMPFFIAAVVVAALVKEFLGANGALTQLLSIFGLEKQNWLANPNVPVFWIINTFTEIWQGAGYGTIIFVASIANISDDLYEAAAIDGVNRWQRITRITLPSIAPLIVMMLTLRVGTVFVQGFDKILLLYMPSTYDTADVLTTYTYRMAFGSQINYGMSAASGLFQSIICTTLLFASNMVSRRLSESSLF